MAAAITALNIKLRMDTRAVAAGADQVRKDVAKVNSIVRRAKTDTQKYEEAAASLTRRFDAGAISAKKYRKLLADVHQQYITGPQRIAAEKAAIEAANEAKRKAAIIERQRAAQAKAVAAEEQRLNSLRQAAMPIIAKSTTDAERFAASLQKLRAAHRANAISAEEYRRGLSALRMDMRRAASGGGSVTRMGNAFSVLSPLVLQATAALGGFWAVSRQIQESIKLAAALEEAGVQFEVLTGSADASKTLLADMRDLANTTALTFDGLQQNARTMLAFGVANEKVLPTLKQIGDITAGDTERMKSMSLAFSQVAAAGRLTGQDLLQMVNAGFNPLQEISKRTGISMLDLKKRMEDGQISAELVAVAFESATSEGGRFYNMLDKSKDTLSGQFRLLQSDIEKLKTQIGEELLPIVKETAKDFHALFEVGGLKELLQYTGELTITLNEINRLTSVNVSLLTLWTKYARAIKEGGEYFNVVGDSLGGMFASEQNLTGEMNRLLSTGKKEEIDKKRLKAMMDNVKAMIELDKQNAKAIETLRNTGREITEKHNPVIAVGRQLGQLMTLLRAGFIDAATFTKERNAILRDTLDKQQEMMQPDALQFGSKEAADFVQKQMFDATNQQIAKLEEQRRLQQLQLEATRESNRLLAELPAVRNARR